VSLAASLLFALPGAPGAAADLPDDRDTAIPCRPTVSCAADIAAPGVFELEAGALYAQGNAGQDTTTIPFLLKQSLTHWLQLQVGNGFTLIRGVAHAQYLDNIVVGPKFHLLDQGELAPSLSLSAEASLPAFAASGYSRLVDAAFIAYASKDLGPLHIDLNQDITVLDLGNSRTLQEYTSLALSHSLPGGFGVALEGYYISPAALLASRDGGVRAALSCSLRSFLVVDLGGDAGFFPSTRAFSLFAGLTIIPAVLWRSAPAN